MIKKLKEYGCSLMQTAPFILTNTIVFVPYLLFLSLSDGVHVRTILPLVFFYTCRIAGLFLIQELPSGIDTFTLLMIALLSGGVGSLLGVIASVYPPLYSVSGILLGLSGSWLVPANSTVNIHERKQGFVNMTAKKYPFAIFLLFLLVGAFQVKSYLQPAIVFALYTLLYIWAYYTIRRYPRYDLDFKDSTKGVVSKEEAWLFLGFFLLIVLMRSSRMLVNIHVYEYAILGISLFFILGVFFVSRGHRFWKLPLWLNLLTIFIGMSLNFVQLFGAFYVRAIYSSEKVISMVYVPYAIGLILNMFLTKPLQKVFAKSLRPLEVQLIGMALGMGMLLLPIPIEISIGVISFFVCGTSSWLVEEFYNTEVLPLDQRVLAKYRIQSRGSVVHQAILMVTVFILITVQGLPTETYLQLTGKATASLAGVQIMRILKYLSSITFLIVLAVVTYLERKENQ